MVRTLGIGLLSAAMSTGSACALLDPQCTEGVALRLDFSGPVDRGRPELVQYARTFEPGDVVVLAVDEGRLGVIVYDGRTVERFAQRARDLGLILEVQQNVQVEFNCSTRSLDEP